MPDPTIEAINNMVSHIKSLPGTRETSLAITKLEEARMWYLAHLEVIKKKSAQMGVGVR